MTHKTVASTIVAALLVLTAASVVAQDRPDALGLYRRGRFEEAVDVCLQELEAQPRSMDSYVVLGWSLLRLERYQDALGYAQQALAISRYDERIIEITGEAYFYLGRNTDALRAFEEYVVLAPTGDRIGLVYYFMGEIFVRLGEYNHADIALSTAVYHSPNTARWWLRLGYARETAEDYQWALAAYDRALELNANLVEASRGRDRVQAALRG
jgi:tetratricopeptide (TPR) repeat protein